MGGWGALSGIGTPDAREREEVMDGGARVYVVLYDYCDEADVEGVFSKYDDAVRYMARRLENKHVAPCMLRVENVYVDDEAEQ